MYLLFWLDEKIGAKFKLYNEAPQPIMEGSNQNNFLAQFFLSYRAIIIPCICT